jgi:hypothetical protein
VDHGNGYSYQTRTGFDFSGGKWKSIICHEEQRHHHLFRTNQLCL